jgi:peptide/nickel transport system permease protein
VAFYALARVIRALILLVGLSLVFFVIAHLTPGGICSLEPERSLASCIHGLGLRQSLPVQYADWIGGYLHGNLGRTAGGQSVGSQILGGFPASAVLLFGAYLVVAGFSALRIMLASPRVSRRTDPIQRIMGLVGLSLPTFWLALVVIYVFAAHWQLLPMGRVDNANVASLWSHKWFTELSQSPRLVLVNLVKHLVLPALTLSTVIVFVDDLTSSRTMTIGSRAGVGAESLRGLRRSTQTFFDALGQLLSTAVTGTARVLPALITGVVIVESVFRYAGLGNLLYTSLGDRDYSTVLALLMVGTALIVLTTLAADLVAGPTSSGPGSPATGAAVGGATAVAI